MKNIIYTTLISLVSLLAYGQSLLDIRDQYTETLIYPTLDLNSYVYNPNGNCYNLLAAPANFQGTTEGNPNLGSEEYVGYRENMTLTCVINYAGLDFPVHEDDMLWVLDPDDNITEINTPTADPFTPGKMLYYLNVMGDFVAYEARVVYYSSELDGYFELPAAFTYMSNARLGTTLSPYMLTIAGPIEFTYSGDTINATIVDTSYIGGFCLDVTLMDCQGAELDTDAYCYEVGPSPCQEELLVSGLIGPLPGGSTELFEAEMRIQADCQISTQADIIYSAKDCIEFLPGFEIELGATLETNADGCDP